MSSFYEDLNNFVEQIQPVMQLHFLKTNPSVKPNLLRGLLF